MHHSLNVRGGLETQPLKCRCQRHRVCRPTDWRFRVDGPLRTVFDVSKKLCEFGVVESRGAEEVTFWITFTVPLESIAMTSSIALISGIMEDVRSFKNTLISVDGHRVDADRTSATIPQIVCAVALLVAVMITDPSALN